MRSKKVLRQISGWGRRRTHLLASLEARLIKKLYPTVPPFIRTYHLTLSAIISSLAILFFSSLAKENINYLWAVSFFLIVHYLTDALDGEVGRRRKTGLVKWGFYTDHFLDILFLASVLLGYLFIFPQYHLIIFIIFALLAVHFFNSLLKCIALDEYVTSGHFGIGPTELTVVTIVFNSQIILFDWTPVKLALIITAILLFLAMVNGFMDTQSRLWRIDEKNKKAKIV